MARKIFPRNRLVYGYRMPSGGVGDALADERQVRIYTDAAATTLANILDLEGVAITNSELTLALPDSFIPLFRGPDGVNVLYAKKTNLAGVVNDTSSIPIHSAPDTLIPVSFTKTGTLTTGNGTTRWYNDTGRTLFIDSTFASVGTVPTGASILVDVNVSGTSIWNATQANRISIAAAANSGSGGAPDDFTVANGQYLTVDLDQIGSTDAGANLVVTVWLSG